MLVARSRRWARPIIAALLAATTVLATAPAAGADSADAKRRAKQLDAQAERTEGRIDVNRQRLDDLAKAASAALEKYRAAMDAKRAADLQAATAERDLAKAVQAVADQRSAVSSYAASAYRSGGVEDLAVFAQLVSAEQPDTLIQGVGLLQRVGDKQAQLLLRMRVAQRHEAETRVLAESTAQKAAEKAAAAEEARKAKDALVAQQRELIADLRVQLSNTRDRAADAHARYRKLLEAERIARARANAFGPIGTCKGSGTVSGYSNGRMPSSALCPLWGAPGHYLRSDAAAQFNLMSREYARTSGRPICVSSSYRSYDQQAAVYAAKPGLAAPPGQSNHGWGLAADLCGGAESDGTSANNWLRSNAGRWNWFHPSWADAGGSGPYEPWHWEFAG